MATATAIKVTATLAKETKGTFVYSADAEDAVVKVVYVQKEAFPNGAPATVTVTVV